MSDILAICGTCEYCQEGMYNNFYCAKKGLPVKTDHFCDGYKQITLPKNKYEITVYKTREECDKFFVGELDRIISNCKESLESPDRFLKYVIGDLEQTKEMYLYAVCKHLQYMSRIEGTEK